MRGNAKQKEFAKMLGISSSYLSQVEGGGILPSINILVAIAKKLNCNLHWLLTGEGPQYVSVSHSDSNTLNKLIQLFQEYPELRGLFGGLVEIIDYLKDKRWERKMFLEILEGMVVNVRDKKERP